MSEIFHHITESPEENDVLQSDKNTLKYLEACNKLFERGFLSHDRILDMNSEILRSIDEGFQFFVNWSNEILLNGKSSCILLNLNMICAS